MRAGLRSVSPQETGDAIEVASRRYPPRTTGRDLVPLNLRSTMTSAASNEPDMPTRRHRVRQGRGKTSPKAAPRAPRIPNNRNPQATPPVAGVQDLAGHPPGRASRALSGEPDAEVPPPQRRGYLTRPGPVTPGQPLPRRNDPNPAGCANTNRRGRRLCRAARRAGG